MAGMVKKPWNYAYSSALDDNYTLCLLDPKQPGKADCGDGYIKR
jgi:hypothetical protein